MAARGERVASGIIAWGLSALIAASESPTACQSPVEFTTSSESAFQLFCNVNVV